MYTEAPPTKLNKQMIDALAVTTSNPNAVDPNGADTSVVDPVRTQWRERAFLEAFPNGGTLLDALQWSQAHPVTGSPAGANPSSGVNFSVLGGQQSAPHEPTTQAEFASLPPGALYVDPGDGKVHRKP